MLLWGGGEAMVDIGFTGTAAGMTPAQAARVEGLLRAAGGGVFRHGMCKGSDAEASLIAHRLGYRVVGYPGHGADGVARREGYADEVRAAKPFLDRDSDIADDCMVLIATPRGDREVMRSGTWATVRRAEKLRRGLLIAAPSGVVVNYYDVRLKKSRR